VNEIVDKKIKDFDRRINVIKHHLNQALRDADRVVEEMIRYQRDIELDGAKARRCRDAIEEVYPDINGHEVRVKYHDGEKPSKKTREDSKEI